MENGPGGPFVTGLARCPLGRATSASGRTQPGNRGQQGKAGSRQWNRCCGCELGGNRIEHGLSIAVCECPGGEPDSIRPAIDGSAGRDCRAGVPVETKAPARKVDHVRVGVLFKPVLTSISSAVKVSSPVEWMLKLPGPRPNMPLPVNGVGPP